MDKTIRRVTDFKEQQAETYRYWQSRTVAERMEAVAEIVRDVYWMKGIDIDSVPMDKTIVRIERPEMRFHFVATQAETSRTRLRSST